MVFVNLLQNSYGQAGRFLVYRLYSGESVDDIKWNIINHMKGEWGDYIDGFERNLDIISGKSLNDLVSRINDLIQDYIDVDYGDLTDYDLLVEGPYTDMSRAFDFYLDYLGLEDDLEDHEEAYFYFYGDYVIRIQGVFPILSGLRDDHNVHITPEFIDKMIQVLI